MNNRKMIVVDLDGTLLTSNYTCSIKTVELLIHLKNKGHIIVIATGRILKSAIEITNGAVFANYIICDNGSVIYDKDANKIKWMQSIPKDIAKQICTLYDEDVEYMDICDLNNYYKYTKNTPSSTDLTAAVDIINRCDAITHMAIIPYNNIEKFVDRLKILEPNIHYFIMQDSFSEKRWIDILGCNVIKYESIHKIAQLEKIQNQDIIAFGDGLNDIHMMQNCGVGVAMGNALDEVKVCANYVTKTHDEDGIAVFLEQFIV